LLACPSSARIGREWVAGSLAVQHRISAGVIVENDSKILLVRHVKPGAYDFWVAPGGGALGDEDLRATAKREAFEECGLHIEPVRMLYVEEFVQPGTRHCKVWFSARLIGGTLDCSAPEASREHIVEAAWLARDEFMGKTVLPPMLHDEYWEDRAAGRIEPRYVGLRQMDFY
jgi:ADP-ribose pyrophosphatase YjhB (NUDIX family)